MKIRPQTPKQEYSLVIFAFSICFRTRTALDRDIDIAGEWAINHLLRGRRRKKWIKIHPFGYFPLEVKSKMIIKMLMKFYYNIEFRILIIKGKITVLFFNYSEDFRIVSQKKCETSVVVFRRRRVQHADNVRYFIFPAPISLASGVGRR